nr:MAG TPA: hypothetical protein [Caudoviricetes sp.]
MSITIFKLSLHHTIYNKHLKKYFKQRIIHIEKHGGIFTSTENYYSHISPISKFLPTKKNRSSLFQIENP